MAIDATYQDNVVLKQEAFQNLLTNIKNYPIIDIDYIAESDEDELHGDAIWENYTDGIPCIKITYGDERTTKGNIIFAEGKKKEISDHKKAINQAQTVVNELTKRKNRWELIYKENYGVYEEKSKQVERFKANFDQIEYNKIAFLKAGWNLLYIATNLNVDDPYVVVPLDATYDSRTIYYVHSNDFIFKRYDFTYTENGKEITADVYSGLPANQQANMLADWAEKVSNREIYTFNEAVDDNGPVILNELGPQFFQYDNILLTKNPFNLVYPGDNYDSSKIYYLRNSASNSFTPYDGNGVDPSSSYYASTEADWRAQVNLRKIYTKDEDTDVKQVYNLTFTSLDSQRARLLSILNGYKNLVDGEGKSIWKEDPDEKEVFQSFIEFILSYNKLVFLDTIGIAGYTVEDIETLKEENPNVRSIITRLEAEDALDDFDWQTQTSSWNADLQGYYTTFYNRIEGIVNTIEEVINENLKYIRKQIRNLSYTIIEYNEYINNEQSIIDGLWEEINTISTFRYDPVLEGAVYNPEREYYTLEGEDNYILYTDGLSNWNNGVQKYVKNDRTMYGYKYVKVGSNIEFTETYTRIDSPYSPTVPEELEIFGANRFDARTQASGTYRITINKHTYEVPIKGFTEVASNQPIYIKSENADNPDHLGNINFFGNLTGAGSIVTNNGNIFASGGTVAAGCYQALRGYSEGNNNIFGPSNTSGLWYDGSSNKLIRTWNISTDTDDVGLGCYQLVLISGDTEKGINNGTRLGIVGNGTTIEFHTGIPGDSNNTNNNLANIKAGNLILGGPGTSNTLTVNNRTLQISHIPASSSDSAHFWRGDAKWENSLTGNFSVSGVVSFTSNSAASNKQTGALRVTGGIGCQGSIYGNRVYGAVFNDYAEYRSTIDLEAGHVVIDQDDGTLKCADTRLLPGAQVISDTFGFSIGEMDNVKTPIATAGRVLVYTYQDRYNYHAGMAVCSAPNGTVDIMTREEIREYPDCIIGIVSEIPEYEFWGTDNIKVNGRIWIKVK